MSPNPTYRSHRSTPVSHRLHWILGAALLGALSAGCSSSGSKGTAAPAESRAAQDTVETAFPDLTTFVKQQSASQSAPAARVGNLVFFAAGCLPEHGVPCATDPHGKELWATDGTPEGTHLVYDVWPGPGDSDPQELTAVGSTLFFTASAPGIGRELWKSDGTAAGTTLVAGDTVPGWSGLSPQYLVAVGETLFFVGQTPDAGSELWKSDGTAQGTVLLKDIFPGQGGSSPRKLTASDKSLFFTAQDDTHGRELWVSDGTARGTTMVAELAPGFSGPNVQEMIALNGGVLFSATDYGPNGNDGAGPELFVSDGTEGGTGLLVDIYPGGGGSYPAGLVALGSSAFFVAGDDTHGRELWTTDGTANGTRLVFDLNPGSGDGVGSSRPFGLGGVAVIFRGSDGGPSEKLFLSDGTFIALLSGDASAASAGNFLEYEGGLLYFASVATYGYEPVFATAGGLGLLKDVNPGGDSGVVLPPIAGPGFMFWFADDGAHGVEPWVSDGTRDNTRLLKDLYVDTSSNPRSLVTADATVFFVADDASGTQLWKSDGTAAGTARVGTIHPASQPMVPVFDSSSGRTFVYLAADDGTSGVELWRTDGTTTTRVKDLAEGATGSDPRNLFAGDGKVFLAATGSHGEEPWVSDGTPAGTLELADLFPGSGSYPSRFTTANGFTFFTAFDGGGVLRLYRSNGTPGGTTSTGAPCEPSAMASLGSKAIFVCGDQKIRATDGTTFSVVTDIDPTGWASISSFTPFGNGYVAFAADDGTSGPEPWVSDGTSAGTYRVADVNPGSEGSSPSQFTMHEGTAYFRAYRPDVGYELWAVDPGGAHVVKDVRPGPESGVVDVPFFDVPGGPLLFTASNGPGGAELWATDDDAAWQVDDLAVGPASSNPSDYAVAGDRVLFACSHADGDRELCGLTIAALNAGSGPTAAPTAAVVAPAAGSTVATLTPTLSGTCDQRCSSVDVWVDGSFFQAVAPDASGNWSVASSALGQGAHSVKAKGTNTVGTGAFSADLSFTVDTQGPAVPAITAPASGATVAKRPAISGTAEADATVSVYLEGSLAGTATADGSGAWTFTPGSDLSDGAHQVAAKATDSAGNVGTQGASVPFTVDAATTVPVITAPAANARVGTSRPTVTGTAEPLATVTVSIDGAGAGNAVADGAGVWAFLVPAALPEGGHAVQASAVDLLGNPSAPSESRSFTVDTTPPAAPVVSAPTQGQVFTTSTPSPLSGAAEPNAVVKAYVDGVLVQTTTADGAGAWSFTPGAQFAEGGHSVTATATDAAGNEGDPSVAHAFTVDTVAPGVPVVSAPAEGARVRTDPAPITGTAEAGAVVTVRVDGVVVGTVNADGQGHWTLTPASPLGDGAHAIVAAAQDVAGNAGGTSATRAIVVDTAAPAAPVLAAPTALESARPVYTGTAEPGSAVTVYLDGTAIGTATAGSDGAFSITQPTQLANGAYTVTARATDAAGNVGPFAGQTAFDLNSPLNGPPETAVVTAPDPETASRTATFTLTSTQPGVTFQCALDGASWSACAGEVTFSDLAVGKHALLVRAVDSMGNPDPTPTQYAWTVNYESATREIAGGGVQMGCSHAAGPESWTALFGVLALLRRRRSR